MAFAPAKAMHRPAFARIANGHLGDTADALPALGRATHAFVRKDMIGKARPLNAPHTNRCAAWRRRDAQ